MLGPSHGVTSTYLRIPHAVVAAAPAAAKAPTFHAAGLDDRTAFPVHAVTTPNMTRTNPNANPARSETREPVASRMASPPLASVSAANASMNESNNVWA
jgi:hypothetical protein